MENFEQRGGLRPLDKLAHNSVGAAKSNERDSEQNAAQYNGPQQGRDEVVEDQVLGLGGAGLEGFLAGPPGGGGSRAGHLSERGVGGVGGIEPDSWRVENSWDGVCHCYY